MTNRFNGRLDRIERQANPAALTDLHRWDRQFDCSQQPLPDNIRVLLWMLDGAQRRYHLARRWQGQAAHDLHVEVEGGDIMVTLPGTGYAVTYYKPANSPQLLGKCFPLQVDRRSPISQAAFVGKAWKLATDKARELGWIA